VRRCHFVSAFSPAKSNLKDHHHHHHYKNKKEKKKKKKERKFTVCPYLPRLVEISVEVLCCVKKFAVSQFRQKVKMKIRNKEYMYFGTLSKE
jgi:tRNA G37 N-methylase Trm5